MVYGFQTMSNEWPMEFAYVDVNLWSMGLDNVRSNCAFLHVCNNIFVRDGNELGMGQVSQHSYLPCN